MNRMKFRLIVLLMLAIEVCCEITRPEIIASTATIYRTKTRQLRIAGFNFPSPDLYKMTFTFEPELIEGVEYTVSVASTTELQVTLLAGHAWRAEAGKLLVKSTIIVDRDGGFQIFPHASDDWTVAEVVADTEDGAFVEDEFGKLRCILVYTSHAFYFSFLITCRHHASPSRHRGSCLSIGSTAAAHRDQWRRIHFRSVIRARSASCGQRGLHTHRDIALDCGSDTAARQKVAQNGRTTAGLQHQVRRL